MLIEIDESVANKASSGDTNALFVLQKLATSQRNGFHIVWATRKVLKQIVQLPELSNLDNNTYSSILNKYSTITSEYKKIGFYTIVTYATSSHQTTDYIVINPKENPQFCFEGKTKLLTENLMDASFFKYIANFWKGKIGLSRHITVEYDKEPGGGDTTAQKYEDYAKNRDCFCLAVLDGDKRHPAASYGDTYQKVQKKHRTYQPFNCSYYGTGELLEVENLIPQELYLTDTNYKHNTIVSRPLTFDMSFFDLKEGLKYKKLGDHVTRDYWRGILNGYPDLLECIDLAEIIRNGCTNSDEYNKECGDDKVIEGFGSKLFDHVLNTKVDDLKKVKDADLTPSQFSEWNRIGDFVVKWCCATKLNKSPLFVA